MIDLIANVALSRANESSVCVGFTGNTFDISRSSNFYFHEETGTAFLMPLFLTSDYMTTFTGRNTRLGLTDFGISSDWVEHYYDNTANKVLEYTATSFTSTVNWCTDVLSTPMGYVFSYFNYTSETDVNLVEVIGYGSSDDNSRTVYMNLYSNHTYELYANNVLVSSGSCHSGTGHYEAGGKKNKAKNGSNQKDTWVTVGVIPNFMKYGVLFIFSTGAEVFYYDERLEGLDVNYWDGQQFFFTNQLRNSVMISELGYKSSGDLLTELYWFGSVPTTTVQTLVNSDFNTTAFTNTVINDDGSAWSTADTMRVKCHAVLNSDSNSPFIYGVIADWRGTVTNTNATEQVSIIDKTLEAHISYPEVSSQSEIHFEVKGISTLQTNDIYVNSPYIFKYQSFYFALGRILDLKYDYTVAYDLDTTKVLLSCNNAWDVLEAHTFKDGLILDGYTLTQAIRRIFLEVGVKDAGADPLNPTTIANIFIQTNSVVIQPSRLSKDEWTFKIDIGATALQGLEQLFEHYAGNWFYDFIPTINGIIFKAGDPSYWSNDTSIMRLHTVLNTGTPGDNLSAYTDTNYANNHDGTKSSKLFIRNVNIDLLPLAGNSVYVSGMNPIKNEYIQVFKRDEDSIASNTLPSLRPKNWVGYELPYGIETNKIKTKQVAIDVLNLQFEKLTTLYRLIEFDGFIQTKNRTVETGATESRMLFKYDIVEVPNIGKMTIIAMRMEVLLHQQTTDFESKNKVPCHYICKQRWNTDENKWDYIKYS